MTLRGTAAAPATGTVRFLAAGHPEPVVRGKRFWFAVIFAIALAVRLALAWLTYEPQHVYTGEAEWIAKSLAQHGRFAGAYAIPTGPTAHCGPFYPSLLALLYWVFGIGPTGELARIGLLVTVNAVACALLPAVAEALCLPLWSGIAAGAAAALIPMHRTAEVFHAWDEPYAALCLMLVLCLFSRWTPLSAQPLRKVLLYGAVWGFLLQIAPPTLLVFCGLSVLGIAACRQRRAELRRWAIVWAAAAVVMLPWAVRNRVQLGGWVFVRSNFGIELRISNNDRSGPASSENRAAGLYRDTHPSINIHEAAQVRAMGEIAYNHALVVRAVGWVRKHPGRFAELTAARIGIFWLGFWRDGATAWLIAMCTAFGIVGAALMRRHGLKAPLRQLAVVWACYPLTYYLVQYLPRYRVPMWWTVLLAAAYGSGCLARAIFPGRFRLPSAASPDATGRSNVNGR